MTAPSSSHRGDTVDTATEDRRPQLLAEKCDTCIFRPGNPMHLRAGRVRGMVDEALGGGGYITCHKTLSYGDHPEIGEAVCRGFYDAHGPASNHIRIIERLGGFKEVTA